MSSAEINGTGVRLRAYRPDDAEAVAAGYDDPLSHRFLPALPSPFTIAHAERFLSEGIASISFTNPGVHTVTATAPGAVPVHVKVCATDGGDGFCGSTKTVPPPNYVYPPSPCATNGKDGFCGSVDTSGPVTHVTNIAAKA